MKGSGISRVPSQHLFLCMQEILLRLLHIVGISESSAEGQQCLQKELTQTHAGDQFAEAYRQHEQRYAAGNVIGVGQDKGDDQRVGDNGRNSAQEAVLTKRVGAQCSEQCRESAENNIGQRTAGQNIAKG